MGIVFLRAVHLDSIRRLDLIGRSRLRWITTTGITRRSSATTSAAAWIAPVSTTAAATAARPLFGRHADRVLQSEMFLLAARWIEPDDQPLAEDLASRRRIARTQDQIQILTVIHRCRHQRMVLFDRSKRPRPVAAVAVDRDLPIPPMTVDRRLLGREQASSRRNHDHSRHTQTRTSHREPRTRSTPHTPTGGWHFPQKYQPRQVNQSAKAVPKSSQALS